MEHLSGPCSGDLLGFRSALQSKANSLYVYNLPPVLVRRGQSKPQSGHPALTQRFDHEYSTVLRSTVLSRCHAHCGSAGPFYVLSRPAIKVGGKYDRRHASQWSSY